MQKCDDSNEIPGRGKTQGMDLVEAILLSIEQDTHKISRKPNLSNLATAGWKNKMRLTQVFMITAYYKYRRLTKTINTFHDESGHAIATLISSLWLYDMVYGVLIHCFHVVLLFLSL